VYCSEVNEKLVLAYQLKGEKGRRVGEGEDMGTNNFFNKTKFKM